MKRQFCSSRAWYLVPTLLSLLALLALTGARPAAAQIGAFPTVTISATDPNASEEGLDPGTFTVTRHLGLNTAPPETSLIVFYQVSGKASNGVDYQTLPGSVTIPPLAFGATIKVTPIDDTDVEGDETVVLQLVGSPLACATCGYNIGVPSNAVVVIADNDGPPKTNHIPSVKLVSPTNGAAFTAPADITLIASAEDPDGFLTIQTVEFFEGTNSLGIRTNFPTLNPIGPFFLVWSDVPAGDYVLRAKVTDDHGAMAFSLPVHITVVETNGLHQPVVNIIATDDTGREIFVVPPWLYIAQQVDPAVFTVTRSGPTNFPITVFYTIGGTATFGVDYILSPPAITPNNTPGATNYPPTSLVVIPAGADSAQVTAWVIDDLLVEGTETIELTLVAPACIAIFPPPPDCYVLGPSNHAVAKILDNDVTPAPVVTVVASDPHASEAGPDPGTFTVSRTGDPTNALTVFYRLGGTAQIGDDYSVLADSDAFLNAFGFTNVVIPAGASSADITITPVDDQLVEGTETVVLRLEQPDWAGYIAGTPDNAVVFIADNDGGGTNQAPFVRLNAPADGSVFIAPATIELRAYAQDHEDGFDLKVEFFAGDTSLGFGQFVASLCPSPYCPFFALTWSNVPPGDHVLTAKATDNAGASSTSDPVHITVESNRPPVVDIVARDPFASEGTNFWLHNTDPIPGAIDTWNVWHVNVGRTNTATFVVRRHGSTNTALNVDYAVGGTASNGVDYVTLPGSVTILPGRYSAQIVVVPIDDQLIEGIETVVLQLKPSPDYTVGFPAHAAAIIIDNDQPRPPCVRLRDGLFHLCGPATNGFCFRVEASPDLLHWTPVCTNVVTDGALHFVDPDTPPLDVRFYRTAPEPTLSPDD